MSQLALGGGLSGALTDLPERKQGWELKVFCLSGFSKGISYELHCLFPRKRLMKLPRPASSAPGDLPGSGSAVCQISIAI